MSRNCLTCQHVKRAEIDRRLAAGEPCNQVARDYGLNPSSLHRHRANCLGLSSSNAIMKETARGTAAVALLPSKDTLANGYFELRDRVDQIVRQAQEQGSLTVAISGLNTIRHTLDSLARLAGHDRSGATEVNVAVQTNVNIDLAQIAERLIKHFDHEPELKARIAQALLEIDDQPAVSGTDHRPAIAGIEAKAAAVGIEAEPAVLATEDRPATLRADNKPAASGIDDVPAEMETDHEPVA